jgi:hypothetical protein
MSDHECDYKMRPVTTYQLVVKSECDVSEHGCDYKAREVTTYILWVER